MKTSEVINRAADLIEERGWIQQRDTWDLGVKDTWGGGAAGSGPMCLEGGLLAALGIGLPDQRSLEREAMLDALGTCSAYVAVRDYLEFTKRLWEWNDKIGRTPEEVIEVLRATALIEAAKEDAEVRVSAEAAR